MKIEIDRDELRSLCLETRARGYACMRNTVEEGVASVAMPFFLGTVEPTGTISIAVPDLNLTPEHFQFLLQNLRAGVTRLETALTREAKNNP